MNFSVAATATATLVLVVVVLCFFSLRRHYFLSGKRDVELNHVVPQMKYQWKHIFNGHSNKRHFSQANTYSENYVKSCVIHFRDMYSMEHRGLLVLVNCNIVNTTIDVLLLVFAI